MDEKVLKIIKLLTEQTRNGKMKWVATSTANEYKLAMEGGTIVINKYTTVAGITAMGFKLYNPTGVLAVNESRTTGGQNYADLSFLFNAAKDSYTQRDAVIDSILDQLE